MGRILVLQVAFLGLVVMTSAKDMHMQKRYGDLDENDDIDEDQFEKIFHLPAVDDPSHRPSTQAQDFFHRATPIQAFLSFPTHK